MTTPTAAPMDHDEAEDLAPPFVLGALEPRLAAALRGHVAGCELPHPEIEELGAVAGYLAEDAEPVEPASSLRARVLAAVRDDGVAVAAPAARPVSRSALLHLAAWRRPVALAALALIVVLAGISVQLAGRLAEAQAYADQLRQATALAAEQGSRTAPMAPAVPGGPSGVAVVGPTGSGRVVLSGLAPLEGNQVYEVWLIGGDGRPIPAGQLETTGAGTGWLETPGAVAAGPVTVAVTREPGPGATTPTPPILTSGVTG
jgi:hypothetical protein